MKNDNLLSQCPSCKFMQEFNFIEYNRIGECVMCEKCHTPYRITNGIVSGTASSIIALSLADTFHMNNFFITLFVTAIVASLTIGGKAIGKSFAINKSNYILYEVSKIISKVYKVKK